MVKIGRGVLGHGTRKSAVSGMNLWMEPIFYMLIVIQQILAWQLIPLCILDF